MEEFDNIIEKYRRELLEFSKNNPMREEKCDGQCDSETNDAEQPEFSAVNAVSKTESFDGFDAEDVQNNTETADARSTVQNTEDNTANSIQSEEYKAPQFDNYDDFLRNNPQSGLLRVQVFAAGQAFPVVNARVVVVLELKNGSRQMFDGLTDINGIVDNIKLPAPSAEMSQSPTESPVLPYSSYTTYIEHPEFVNAEFINVPVFAGIKSIQSVELIPTVNVGNQPQIAELNEGESFTRLKGAE